MLSADDRVEYFFFGPDNQLIKYEPQFITQHTITFMNTHFNPGAWAYWLSDLGEGWGDKAQIQLLPFKTGLV
jgi:hypothetical protein